MVMLQPRSIIWSLLIQNKLGLIKTQQCCLNFFKIIIKRNRFCSSSSRVCCPLPLPDQTRHKLPFIRILGFHFSSFQIIETLINLHQVIHLYLFLLDSCFFSDTQFHDSWIKFFFSLQSFVDDLYPLIQIRSFLFCVFDSSQDDCARFSFFQEKLTPKSI